MLRTTFLCSVLAAASMSACATDDSQLDELAGEESDDAGGKTDSANASYFTVTPDTRACSLNARCGGFFVARANRQVTDCGFGSTMARCYVDSIDWSGTQLLGSVATFYEERLRSGKSIMLRGAIVATGVHPPDRPNAKLAAQEVWVAGSATGSIDEGVFVLAKRNLIHCAIAPCPNVTETRLNSTTSANIHEIDFSVSGATDAVISSATSKLHDATPGVIVVGYRYMDAIRKGRTANQFFTKVAVSVQH